MRISGPVFIKKTGKGGYEITGNLEGYGTVREYGKSEEEAKERFFDACNWLGRVTSPSRQARRKTPAARPG
jgi:hypothetical protein